MLIFNNNVSGIGFGGCGCGLWIIREFLRAGLVSSFHDFGLELGTFRCNCETLILLDI